MNSLDDVFEQLQYFQRALLEFDEEVRASAESLRKTHDELCGLWQDEAASRYRRAYESLAQPLDHYLRADAPRFERFLEVKVRQLDQYMQGA